MRNRYIFGPEKPHDRSREGHRAITSIDEHQSTMDSLDKAMNTVPIRQKPHYSKFGRHVVLALRQLRADVDVFLVNHVVNSRFGLLTGLKQDESWRTMVPSVPASPDGVVQAISDGQPQTAEEHDEGAEEIALDDEVHEPTSNSDGLA